jgi:hypothetical protein
MENEFIDDLFADVDKFYPGSKRKRRESKQPEIISTVGWDAKPYIKTLPNGLDVEMFTIGALANALGRPIPTIRLWMKEGNLPHSPYRLPTKKDVHGNDHAGRRLYTRPMIEVAMELFTKAGLMNGKRIEWSQNRQVSKELDEAWSNLREADKLSKE